MKHLELNAEVGKIGADGFYQLSKDKEAIQAFLEEEIEPKRYPFKNLNERYEFLIENKYYENFLNTYSMPKIRELHKYADSFEFQYQSYMAVSKFYKDYALKTNNKKHYLENYEEHVVRVAMALAKGDFQLAKQAVYLMMTQQYQPATPTYMNAGLVRAGQMTSCFLIEVQDSLNSINFIENTARQLSKEGGGVGINVTNLRASGSVIKGIEGVASGVLPFCKSLEQSFAYINQLGTRPGSGVAYLNIFHMDVIDFLASKKENADEKLRLPTLNIGLIVPDIFMELAENDEELYLFDPYYIEKEYGERMSNFDMTIHYREMLKNENLRKEKSPLSARQLLNEVAQIQLESGYPYILFIDNANREHVNAHISRVNMSNLCSEIAQAQTPSIIDNLDKNGNFGPNTVIGMDISCNLGSTNIERVMEHKDMQDVIHASVALLSSVSASLNIPNAPSIMNGNTQMKSIGLGAMNLQGYLAKNGIVYGSKESIDFTRTYFMMMNYYSLEKSMLLAKETGETYYEFEGSTYADGTYFDKYLEKDYSPRLPRVQKLFMGMHIPTPEDWELLKDQVMVYGVYNSYRLTIPPTGSISYLCNATAAIMPVTELIESREYGNSKTHYPMPFLNPMTKWVYKTAYEIDMKDMLNVVRAAQEHIDQAISCTLFVQGDIATNKLVSHYIYAWKLGLKTLYYTRAQAKDKASEVAECIACSV